MRVVVTGDKELDAFFATLTGKLQRGAIRKGVRASGTVLVNQVRENIKRMTSATASSNRQRKHRRISRRTGRATSLAQTITQRAWSRAARGIIGTVVGGSWPDGAHAHLVEFGHRIVTTSGRDTGRRARPVPFQRTAERQVAPRVLAAQREKLAAELRKLRA